MIYIKHLPEHIIVLLTPQQWLSIILRIKVSLPVGETKTTRITPVPASPSSSLVFFTSDSTLQHTFSLTVVHWDTMQLISCLFALPMLFLLPETLPMILLKYYSSSKTKSGIIFYRKISFYPLIGLNNSPQFCFVSSTWFIEIICLYICLEKIVINTPVHRPKDLVLNRISLNICSAEIRLWH